MKITRDKYTPIYAQLMEIILKNIQNGEWKKNEQIPSERELQERYSVSRTTVRQAISELEKKGIIHKIRGKGCFVSPQTFHQESLKIYRLTTEMEKLGKKTKVVITGFSEVHPSFEIMKEMKKNEEDLVYEIIRHRLIDNQVISIEKTYLPKDIFPDFKKSELVNTSLYSVLKSKYDVPILRVKDRFKAVLISPEDLESFGLEKESAAMQIERVSYYNHSIVEYSIEIMKSEQFYLEAVTTFPY